MNSAKKMVKKAASASKAPAAAIVLVPGSADNAANAQLAEGRYVYGVIHAAEPVVARSNLGAAGEEVYTVDYRDIAAVVSRTPLFIFDPTRDNALAHEHVIETVMKTHTIIPMSFGTVFRTDEDVREVLRSTYPSLQSVLRQMTGKVEFGLKATWDRDCTIEELKREHDEIHRFHRELTRTRLQSTYFARMQLGRMIDKALAELAASYVRSIYQGLRGVSVASRENKPIGDKMILNAAFLVEGQREAEFEATVNRVAHSFGDRLNFKYTGPWPPYNFINIHLKLERGRAV
jgi:Gas vesicle synthesis protein GvpL/GvpF